ncbi:MAG: hypothetical protein Q7R45_07100 [Sulfuricaulis sp.]|nr:hypothetical protein [Sulfuricaulis sp.]
MIKKQLLRAGVRLVLFAALFAQVAVAANACLTPSSMRVQLAAYAASSHCEQSDNEINLNLCLYQWADQSDQSTTPPVIAVPTAAVLTVPHAAQRLLPWISPIVAGNAGHDPPIPIRFCSFLI